MKGFPGLTVNSNVLKIYPQDFDGHAHKGHRSCGHMRMYIETLATEHIY